MLNPRRSLSKRIDDRGGLVQSCEIIKKIFLLRVRCWKGKGVAVSRLKTMTTQFIDGDPNGVRVCLRTLSPVTAIVVPRPLLSRAKQILELPTHGVYYLINDDEGAISRIYVGQTTQGISRLDDHKVKKGFWSKAILFLADDKVFTLDIISGLEKYAIEQAQQSKRYTVENHVNPKYRIDQYEQPIIEEIYEEISFRMATFGYDLDDTAELSADGPIFSTSRRKFFAKGIYTGEKFEVLDGSPVDLRMPAKNEKYNRLREELIASGDLVVETSGLGMLQKKLAFGSPSGAADFVLGGSNNGWTEWKDSEGKTLDMLYRQ